MVNVTNCKFYAKKEDVKITFVKQGMFQKFVHHILALCVVLNNLCSCVITTHLLTRLAWT